MNTSNSNMNHKRGNKQLSSFHLPVEVCVIEDDNETTSQTRAQEVQSKRENSSMPSFNLIDEELEEDEPAFDIENDDCKIITEQAVVDHIHEKAKNFPVLTKSEKACSPSSEALILTRKRCHEKHLDLYSELDVLEQTERSKIPQQTGVNPSSKPGEAERNGHGINNYLIPMHDVTAGSLGTTMIMDDTGWLPLEPEDSMVRTLTEETIFDHIRKKAKNFPAFNKSNSMESEFLIRTKEHSLENLPEFRIAASDISEVTNYNEGLRDTTIFSDLEPGQAASNAVGTKAGIKAKHNILFGSSHGTYGKSNLTPKVLSTHTDISSIKMLSFVYPC